MPTERTVRVNETTVRLREWGSSGAPAVFWHALGDHTSMQMVEAGPILADEFGVRVIGVDAPGFGGSSRLADDQYAFSALVSFAAGLLAELDLPRPAWVGSSWGAALGVHVAAAHPDRLSALVLLDGGYLDDGFDLPADTLEGLQEYWRGQPGFRFPDWAGAFEEWEQIFERWDPALESSVRSALREEGGAIVSIMGPELFGAAMYYMAQAPLAEAQATLGTTDLPVLLLAATEPSELEEGRAASIVRFRQRLPAAEIQRVAAPHLMLESHPREVAEVIGPWLRARVATN